MGQPTYNDKRINKVIEVLEILKEREPDQSRAQAALNNRKQDQARQDLRDKFGNMTIHGPVTFGNNSPINQVNVEQFIAALTSEVERLPEGDDKSKMLAALAGIASNPLFGSIAGASVGEVVKKLIGG